MLGVFVFTRKVSREIAKKVPKTVTIRGSLFIFSGTEKEGDLNTKVEKNQPAIIVPKASRRRAFVRFGFSSPIGEKEDMEGLLKKQNKTIRKL